MKLTNKLVRYSRIDVDRAFEKEDELLQQIQAGEIGQALMLWQAKTPTLVLPSGKKWPVTLESENSLRYKAGSSPREKQVVLQFPNCRGSLIYRIFTIGLVMKPTISKRRIYTYAMS